MEGPSRRLNVFVWSPVLSMGGGRRLLTQLVRGMARDNGIGSVRLATTPALVAAMAPDLAGLANVSFHPIPEDDRLARGGWGAWLPPDSPAWQFAPFGPRKGIAHWISSLRRNRTDRTLQTVVRGMDVCYAFWPHGIDPFPIGSIPIVCTFQDAILLHYPEFIGLAYATLEWERNREWARRAAAVVVSSRNTDADFRRYLGDVWTTPTIIPHRILPDHRTSDPELPFALPDRFIVYPANTTPHKNHANLLTAWARLPREQRLPLVLFGHGADFLQLATHPPYAGAGAAALEAAGENGLRLASLAKRLGLEVGRDVVALGYVPDEHVLTITRRATALVMPSLNEGGGSYPVEEALSLGTPVLCSDIPVMREHLNERSAKVAWFDPYSPDSIRDAYLELMRNYDVYKTSAVEGIKDQRPTWEQIAGQYVTVFNRVVHQK